LAADAGDEPGRTATAGRTAGTAPLGVDEFASERDLLVLDVRQPAEWAEGHIRDAVYITGAEITRRAAEIPQERPVAAICGSGYRSSVAASVLQRRGHGKVFNVLGGMTGWKAEDLPVTE
jgi:hydroxyacylglutathione hydrolase